MRHTAGVFVAGLVCVLVSTALAQTPPPNRRKVTIPPLITKEPAKTIAFREGESVELPCEARGEPDPEYQWEMNDEEFDPSGNDGRIARQPGVGTLIFARPLSRDEAIYQCFASNQVGRSASVRVNLRQAYLEPFQTRNLRTHTPRLGHSLILRCVPPRSFPKPDVFWATVSEGESFVPIDLTDRVTIDPEGNLNFANVISTDRKEGKTYACVVQNTVMRSVQQGEYQRIEPQGVTPENLAPHIMWTSPTHQVALRSQTLRIKCIFSGHPTPHVDWQRLGGAMPRRSRQESFGQELVIEDIQFEDAGKYECQGQNDETPTPERRSFDVSVQAAPYWVTKPQSVDAAENETAVFTCIANAIPEPVVFWFLNGVPMSKVPDNPRRKVEKNHLTFYNMSKTDAQVVQCNVTNKHGYSFANAYLNVLTEPAFIRDPPSQDARAAEGQTVNLTCRVFGSPKPIVVWRKGNEQLTGGRFKVMPTGHLQISDLSLVDAGIYTCTAMNKFGNDTRTGKLTVRRKTRIQTRPRDVMVYENTEAKFTCTATTDPEEVSTLKIEWKKDGQIIDYVLAQRVFKNDMDNSLTISGTISLDTGKYTCVASNALDSDEASASLVVQAPPDPPNNVRVRCSWNNIERNVLLEWQPGKENYAPILNFIIQYNTSFTPDTFVDIANNVSQNQRSREIILSPWGNYTFRVLARNKIGVSPPSDHTTTVCNTQPGRPVKNPDNVVGEGALPDNLVIYWTPMPKIEQNAPSFWYILTWRRADIPNSRQYTQRVDEKEAYHYVVPDRMETYKPFFITVKAANSQGEAMVPPEQVTVPLEAPSNVIVNSVSSTKVNISFPPVDMSPDRVRGYFRGYRIQFWKTQEGAERMREQDFILRNPFIQPRTRFRRQVPKIGRAHV